jgi:hypothetical protein
MFRTFYIYQAGLPARYVSALIGVRGSSIQRIKAESRAHVDILSEPLPGQARYEGTRQVVVSADAFADAEIAMQLIQERLDDLREAEKRTGRVPGPGHFGSGGPPPGGRGMGRGGGPPPPHWG